MSIDQKICVLCEMAFPVDDVIEIAGCLTCAGCKPQLIARIQQGAHVADYTLAREGRLLVMGLHTPLPKRCIACNQATDYFHEVVVSFYRRGAGQLLKRRHSHPINVGLCDVHRELRRKAVAIGWWSTVVSIPVVLALLFFKFDYALFVAVLSVVFWTACGVVARLVKVVKSTEDCIWLKGVCAAYLDELP